MKQTKCPQCGGRLFERIEAGRIYRCKRQNCEAMISVRTGIQVWWSTVLKQYVTLPG